MIAHGSLFRVRTACAAQAQSSLLHGSNSLSVNSLRASTLEEQWAADEGPLFCASCMVIAAKTQRLYGQPSR